MAGRQSASWSLPLGQVAGVPVRLHFFFSIFVVLTLAFALRDQMIEPCLVMLGVLLVSLLLHELAHAAVALRLGGRVDEIVIGPFGGLVSPRVPDEPEVQISVAMAGPLVHMSLAMAAAAVLMITTDVDLLGLMRPVVPVELVTSGDSNYLLLAGKLTLWLNLMLLLINLLPAYPFDGGPALRATLWPMLGRRTACIVTSRVAMIVAVAICVLAIFVTSPEPHTTLPPWAPLVTLAVFLFFSAQQDLAAVQRGTLGSDTAGYHVPADGVDLLDELWGEEELEEDAVLVKQRKDERRARREQARRAQEEYEDAQVDDVLARLHKVGIDQLSGEDRALLDRASERYRQRKEQQGDL